MRVLVACEFSGVVREAFGHRGHKATSCDFLPTTAPTSRLTRHHTGDVLLILDKGWDIMIAHPPCTYLASSGARWFRSRMDEQNLAVSFFIQLVRAAIPKIAVENPVGVMSTLYRKPDQIIQPWMFGHNETKATCLWLENLPRLESTRIVYDLGSRIHFESPGIKQGMTRAMRRSLTYTGIAEAMADQWG